LLLAVITPGTLLPTRKVALSTSTSGFTSPAAALSPTQRAFGSRSTLSDRLIAAQCSEQVPSARSSL
jgi:hypothetical protein